MLNRASSMRRVGRAGGGGNSVSVHKVQRGYHPLHSSFDKSPHDDLIVWRGVAPLLPTGGDGPGAVYDALAIIHGQ